ncbi:Multidrug resistance protein MdtH [bacterium HR19]|nr:Multidrug resistance protein MdtH [bacterium HR19]
MVLALAFLRGLSAAVFSVSLPFLNIYFFGSGYNMGSVGLLTGISTLIGAIARIPSGFLSDKVGARRILLLGIVMRSFALLSVAFLIHFSAHLIYFQVPLILNSFGFSLIVTSSNTIISHLDEEKKPYVLSIVRVGINIGFSLGPILGGFISEFSFSLLFFISSILSFLLIFCLIPLRKVEVENFPKSSSAENGYQHLNELKKSFIVEMFSPISDTFFMPFFISLFFSFVVVSQFLNSFPVYASFIGFSNREIGYFFTINGLFVVLFQFPIINFILKYLIKERRDKLKAMCAGIIFYFASFNLFAVFKSFFWLAFCVIILTLGEIIFMTFSSIIVMDESPTGRKGLYLGFSEFIETVGWSVGKYFGGAMFDMFKNSPSEFWLFTSSPLFLAIIFSFIFYIKLIREKNQILR